MSVAYIQEFAIGDRTTTNYDFVADKIGDGPFQGLIAHTAGFDDEIVGTAGAVFGGAGVNLFGGAVLPRARGRGVYRALTAARWQEAVERGTPALTVQAGRMSMPVLARLGFVKVGEARMYVDDVGAAESSAGLPSAG